MEEEDELGRIHPMKVRIKNQDRVAFSQKGRK
jgi:hypothetical protein